MNDIPATQSQIVLPAETLIDTLHSMLSERDQQIALLRAQLIEANKAIHRLDEGREALLRQSIGDGLVD